MSRKRKGTVEGFAERLEELIKNSGYNCKIIAKKIGRERKAVYGYKNGASIPDGVVIVRLCEVLNTTPNYLLLGKDD